MFLLPFPLLEELLCVYPQSERVESLMRCSLWDKRDSEVGFKKTKLVLGSQVKGRAQPGKGLMPGW